MAIKKRRTTLTMAAATGSVTLGLGASYARLLRLEVKGDDANVDDDMTVSITDADGRLVLTAVDIGDAGRDDSTTKRTNQTFSTVGEAYAIVHNEALNLGSEGAVQTDNVGGGPAIARSPVTFAVANGTSTDVIEFTLFVEV